MSMLTRPVPAAVVDVWTHVPPKVPVDRDSNLRLAGEVKGALRAAGYPSLRHVNVFACGGCVVLRGSAPSFHVKQVAQEIAMRAAGVDAVCNEIEAGNGATPRAERPSNEVEKGDSEMDVFLSVG
ncbi:MAG: hypothetical protein B7Z73_04985 [Planctomycetia bacterium 21-64-5]|nr:MAG: hypothetical protein B7Z73_04985 [Planctomycetia bacterium 21-64-5]HQU41904.1 BON domain-containing protein [Pirellulales bacterium]